MNFMYGKQDGLVFKQTAERGSASNSERGESDGQEENTLYYCFHNIFYSIMLGISYKRTLTRPSFQP